MPLLATYNDAQIILPMTGAAYNPANGGLIAALNQFAIQNYDFKACVEQHVANHCTDRNAVYGVIDEVIIE